MCRVVQACENKIKIYKKTPWRLITYWRFPLGFLCIRESD